MADDIRDLLGRYATGSLTTQERERLFDAALSDQELFEELAREQELKFLLDQPGARNRMIRALDSPARKAPWILAAAIAAALSVVVVAFLMRPVPKPPQVAIMNAPPAPIELPKSEPQPAPVPKSAKSRPAVTEPRQLADQPARDLKELDQVAPAPAPQPVEKKVEMARAMAPRAQQFSPGGPKQTQQVEVAAATGSVIPPFGFHYSIETAGHLIIVPQADGYLLVKSGDGAILFAHKQIAAAITTDIALPDADSSVFITLSQNPAPVLIEPAVRTAPSGTVEGISPLALNLKIK
jgi:hypothetical protein